MNQLTLKQRSYYMVPGRIRIELFGIKNEPEICEKFEKVFGNIEGVQVAKANPLSGKVLVCYDEELISLEVLTLYLKKFEEVLFKKQMNLYYEKDENADLEAAASVEQSLYADSYFQTMPYMKNQSDSESLPPLPLTLAVSGIGVLGIKQLFWGRSALAGHPIPFYLSGALAIGTGYSFFKKGFQKLGKRQRAAADFLLGASALALALVRENLVVLMGMSVLQYLNWKRQAQVKQLAGEVSYTCPDVERYSKRMERLGLLAAGACLAITRNPLASFALLLAANPRPLRTAVDYTWKQAEYLAEEHQQLRPKNGSMFQLSKINTVVFDDLSLVTNQKAIRTECQSFLQALPPNTEITFLENRKKESVSHLKKWLAENYGIVVKDKHEISPKMREQILYVTDDRETSSQKIVSFYPTVKVSQLPSLTESYEKAMEVQKMVNDFQRSTRTWNVTGSLMAVPMAIHAPLINLMSDAFTLNFLIAAKRKTEKLFVPIKHANNQNNVQANNIPWHSMSNDKVIEYFHTDSYQGLKEQQVKKIARKFGKNILQPKERPHWFKDFTGQLKEFTTIILGVTALTSMFTGHLIDGLTMSSILLLNAGINTFQERKTQQTVETMTKFIPPKCRVLRGGEVKELSAEELVPGDVVIIEAGERVPADLRILESWNLEADESALTGESIPVLKGYQKLEESVPISDRTNMLYMGTHITRGKGKAVVVQTGNNTEIGHLFQLLSNDSQQETPLQKQVTKISKTFMKGALIIGGIVFAAGLLRGIPVTEMIPATLALTASAIPEGLPVTITVALTAGILRMAKKNSLTRKISALETLGRVTVICSDKTGTLTKNEMTVKKIATISHEFTVTGEGYCPEGQILNETGKDSDDLELEKILKVGVLCSDSSLHKEDDQWVIKGDPTEGALLTLAAKKNIGKKNFENWKRVHEIPFDSNRGLMTVVCHEKEDDCYLMTKGSVEKIIQLCKYYEKNGKKHPLTKYMREKILAKAEEYSNESLRVLGFAYRPIKNFDENCKEDIEKELIYLGMAGMMDPPKEDVAASIREAIELGVKPVMITGDHPNTASAIAKQIGIPAERENVLTGMELDTLSDQELEERIHQITVFARVTPNHKLRIVQTLQKQGAIVAMTGDGVNDSLAIKQADVGIAMGQNGTQLTKETADIVLNEDNFGAIVDGVKEGRTIIGNIRKALGCLLCGNLAEIIVTSTAVISGLPLPIIPIQILLMNLITDALPAMVLAVNPGSKSKQTKRQEIADRTLYKQVATRGILLGLGSFGLFMFSLQAGASLLTAQTIAFSTLVVGQLIQTFSWRQLDSNEKITDFTKDRYLVGALGLSSIALLMSIYVPPLRGIFKTAPLSIASWGAILVTAGSSAFLARPIGKLLKRETKNHENLFNIPAVAV